MAIRKRQGGQVFILDTLHWKSSKGQHLTKQEGLGIDQKSSIPWQDR